ncbi:MAG: RsmE family RNA methyltransferase [Oscillospiraceae bacterium]
MPKFFVGQIDGERAVLTGEDAAHIGRSLRMKPGDALVLSCAGEDFSCEILQITAETVECAVLSRLAQTVEPRLRVTLFQAMPKADKLELIVQKATELGVFAVVPVLTEFCVSRPDTKSFEKKRARLIKISEAAAKQSGRSIIPQISEILSLEQAVSAMKALDAGFLFYEKGGAPLRTAGLESLSAAGILIGSEGGFSAREAELCRTAGLQTLTLGKRILRCETAPIAALAAMFTLSGDMD